jgi:adenylate kinase
MENKSIIYRFGNDVDLMDARKILAEKGFNYKILNNLKLQIFFKTESQKEKLQNIMKKAPLRSKLIKINEEFNTQNSEKHFTFFDILVILDYFFNKDGKIISSKEDLLPEQKQFIKQYDTDLCVSKDEVVDIFYELGVGRSLAKDWYQNTESYINFNILKMYKNIFNVNEDLDNDSSDLIDDEELLLGLLNEDGSLKYSKIALVGPPAVGKGTLAKQLSSKLDLPIIEVGQLVRNSDDEKIKKIIDKGELLDDYVVTELVQDYIEENELSEYILDGYPRTTGQLDIGIESGIIDYIIFMIADEDTLKSRIEKRSKENPRNDDKVFDTRIEKYEKNTAPILDELEDNEIPHFVLDVSDEKVSLNEKQQVVKLTTPNSFELAERLATLKGIYRVAIETVNDVRIFFDDKKFSEKEIIDLVSKENKTISESLNENKAFTYHEELNPKFWTPDGRLLPEVRERLLEIANEFYEEVDLNELTVLNIHLTGSNVNYNYTDSSDLDVHLIVDFNELGEKAELAKQYANTKRTLWNKLHNIFIKGHEVEVYIEDISAVHDKGGLYSLTEDKWISIPNKEKPEIDERDVDTKADALKFEIDHIEQESKKLNPNYEELYNKVEDLRKKIISMRRESFAKGGGDFSVENLVFKTLRNDGYIGKLVNMSFEFYDKMFSIDENINEKAKSKQQQRFFGMVKAVRNGDLPRSRVSKEVLEVVDSKMTDEQIDKFASTKHSEINEEYLDLGITKDYAKKVYSLLPKDKPLTTKLIVDIIDSEIGSLDSKSLWDIICYLDDEFMLDIKYTYLTDKFEKTEELDQAGRFGCKEAEKIAKKYSGRAFEINDKCAIKIL